jgi:hypothetical protein
MIVTPAGVSMYRGERENVTRTSGFENVGLCRFRDGFDEDIDGLFLGHDDAVRPQTIPERLVLESCGANIPALNRRSKTRSLEDPVNRFRNETCLVQSS